MKILVLSDSHGDIPGMLTAVEQEQPDRLIHLGDMLQDAEQLSGAYPDLPLDTVCGNCDGWCDVPNKKIITLEGHRLMLTHGHRYRVKSGLQAAMAAARTEGADILLFGHTHLPVCDRQDDLWVINPGTVRGPMRRTYAVLELNPWEVHCRICELF